MQQYVNVPIITGGSLPVGTTYIFAFPVPDDNEGGGITVTSVESMSNVAIAAASAPILTVVTMGSASAGSIIGTIANCGSHAWGAGTVASGTLSTVWADVDASNYYVAVKWEQTAVYAGSSEQDRANLVIGYQQGR